MPKTGGIELIVGQIGREINEDPRIDEIKIITDEWTGKQIESIHRTSVTTRNNKILTTLFLINK